MRGFIFTAGVGHKQLNPQAVRYELLSCLEANSAVKLGHTASVCFRAAGGPPTVNATGPLAKLSTMLASCCMFLVHMSSTPVPIIRARTSDD